MDLCTTYHITDPEDFVEQWMAFSASHLNSEEPTLTNLNDLERKELAAKLKRDSKQSAGMGIHKAPPIGGHSFVNVGSPSAKIFGHTASFGFAANDAIDDVMDSYISRTPKVSFF